MHRLELGGHFAASGPAAAALIAGPNLKDHALSRARHKRHQTAGLGVLRSSLADSQLKAIAGTLAIPRAAHHGESTEGITPASELA